ncbi:hypothetical protein [Alkalilimnicola ehrlichii]|nr:hypothetical protein [Alkalilimnicola ehrlichii]
MSDKQAVADFFGEMWTKWSIRSAWLGQAAGFGAAGHRVAAIFGVYWQ